MSAAIAIEAESPRCAIEADSPRSPLGLISFDWSNWKDGKDGWAPAKPMDCEEKMLAQAKVTKDASPTTRVWVYRNCA